MLHTFVFSVHVVVCVLLILVVLLQQGKGGGLGPAFGGGGARQVFGGRGAGDLLVRITAVLGFCFFVTSLSLGYLASSGDRALKRKAAQEAAAIASKPQESKPSTASSPEDPKSTP